MVGKPISNDPTTGTDLEQNAHAVEPTDRPHRVREYEGIEQLELRVYAERNLLIICNKVLEVVDGLPTGFVTFYEICRTDSKPPWREAVERLIADGIIGATDEKPQRLTRIKR